MLILNFFYNCPPSDFLGLFAWARDTCAGCGTDLQWPVGDLALSLPPTSPTESKVSISLILVKRLFLFKGDIQFYAHFQVNNLLLKEFHMLNCSKVESLSKKPSRSPLIELNKLHYPKEKYDLHLSPNVATSADKTSGHSSQDKNSEYYNRGNDADVRIANHR